MSTATLSTKGQLIIPKSIRDARGWGPGQSFEVEERGEALLLRPVSPFAPTRIEDVIGSAGYRGPKRSDAEIEQAARDAVRRRWRGP